MDQIDELMCETIELEKTEYANRQKTIQKMLKSEINLELRREPDDPNAISVCSGGQSIGDIPSQLAWFFDLGEEPLAVLEDIRHKDGMMIPVVTVYVNAELPELGTRGHENAEGLFSTTLWG